MTSCWSVSWEWKFLCWRDLVLEHLASQVERENRASGSPDGKSFREYCPPSKRSSLRNQKKSSFQVLCACHARGWSFLAGCTASLKTEGLQNYTTVLLISRILLAFFFLIYSLFVWRFVSWFHVLKFFWRLGMKKDVYSCLGEKKEKP